jgi:hypothetical protein
MKELTQEQLEKAVGGLRTMKTSEKLESASATGSKAKGGGGGNVRPL